MTYPTKSEYRERPVGGTGKWVIDDDGSRWWSVPYTVISPHGVVMGCAYTRRGALKLLRRAKQDAAHGTKQRVVYEEEADDVR